MSTPHEIEYTLVVYSPDTNVQSTDGNASYTVQDAGDLEVGDLELISSMELEYAKEFTVDYYQDKAGNKYTLITVGQKGFRQYFMLSDSDKKPNGVSDNVVLLSDVDKTYLVSTSVMDLIVTLDALDSIHLSGTDAMDWYIPEAKDAINSGKILYAGKYSAPDYELLVSEECNFAIENTMIYHNPEVKEKLESLGIPVMVERSSYEKDPLGRLEWIKLYGLLYDKEDEANSFFESQKSRVNSISDSETTGLTVAVFSIDSNGMITVRKPGDYITAMVEDAGGIYVPANIEVSDDNALSTMKITMEDFYLEAVDADVLIYNSTIEGEIKTIDELVAMADILSDFKAVKSGNVYCMGKGYFQQSADVAEFIEDVHIILTGEKNSLKHLFKLEE
jgi:iron complex transport system substrate-binding protein